MKKKRPTIFRTKDRPHFDADGNLLIPKGILFGGQVKPKLGAREWWMLVLLSAKNAPAGIERDLVGHRTTVWRTTRRLREKGYID